MPSWKIYYDDGSTFNNFQVSAIDAPSFGVICIVFPDDLVGRIILHRHDWYYWIPSEGRWSGGDIHGLLDRLLHNLGTIAIKQGRSTSNATFRQIMGLADKDKDFPPKSGKV